MNLIKPRALPEVSKKISSLSRATDSWKVVPDNINTAKNPGHSKRLYKSHRSNHGQDEAAGERDMTHTPEMQADDYHRRRLHLQVTQVSIPGEILVYLEKFHFWANFRYS
jgi:hypothetical protein